MADSNSPMPIPDNADHEKINTLIAQLAISDDVERQYARECLVEIGRPAVPALIKALDNPQMRVRWEAAKALAKIADPVAAAKLVATLADEESDVRWVAGDALIAIGRPAIEPLLAGLIENRDSNWLYQGAHHVLHELIRRDASELDRLLATLLKSLSQLEAAVAVPVAAERALEEIRQL